MAITINGSGTITGISAGGLPDGSVTADDIESTLDLSGKTVTLPAGTGGKIGQVLSAVKTNTASYSSGSWNTILSIAVTPSSTSSKIWLTYDASFGGGEDAGFGLWRGTTQITLGDANGSRTQIGWGGNSRNAYEVQHSGGNYLDSPSTTSATTYYLKIRSNANTVYVNRASFDENASNSECAITTLTLMEVLP